MPKKHRSFIEATSTKSTITNEQLDILYIQVKSLVRYFKTRLFDDSILSDIQKRICELAKVKHISKLTQNQYNDTIHYLQNMESVMHQYYWCILLIERNLLVSLLARDIDRTDVLYNSNKLCAKSKYLERIEKLSKKLINLKVLKSFTDILIYT